MIKSSHTINEDYDHWAYRKRNVNSKAIIWGGAISILLSIIALLVQLIGISIITFILGVGLILIGKGIRISQI